MYCYEVEIGGERKRASEILRTEEGIGGMPEVLNIIGDIYVGGGAEGTVKVRLFQFASNVNLDAVEEALKKCGLGAPTQEVAVRSAAVISAKILQDGNVVFPHTESIQICGDGQMLDTLIVLGWSQKAGAKEFILRLKDMDFPAGTTFAGVIPQE